MATGDVLKIGASGDQEFAANSVAVVTSTFTASADIVETSVNLTNANILDAWVGWLISGYGIPDGATIVSANEGAGTAVISAPATETASIVGRATEPDPGAIGAGALWSRQDPDAPLNVGLSLRNQANDGWLALGPAYYDANGWLAAQIMIEAGGLVILSFPRNTTGDYQRVAVADGNLTLDASLSGNILLSNYKTADPVAGGALWVDTAAGRVVKASAG